MNGTDFPTDENWLLCSGGCNRYYPEHEISCEDANYQWCIECHSDWAARQSANAGVEGWEQ